jgi:hypothetical protein
MPLHHCQPLPALLKSSAQPLQAHYDDLKAEHDAACQQLERCRGELQAARTEARSAAEQVRGAAARGVSLACDAIHGLPLKSLAAHIACMKDQCIKAIAPHDCQFQLA